MNVNHLDARAITQPGGMYAGINDTLLQGVAAYLQSKEREAQAQRQMRRDEVGMGREQFRDAMMAAERTGVAPVAQDAGWLRPDMKLAIEAARGRFQQGEARQALQELAMQQKLAESGMLPPGAGPDVVARYEQSKKRRALEDSRAQLGLDADRVRLGAMKDEAFKNSPLISGLTSTAKGVGDWLGKAGLEAVKAKGREKDDPVIQKLRDELMRAEVSPNYTPWGQQNGIPLKGADLEAYRAQLRRQLAAMQVDGAPGVAGVPGQASAPPMAGPVASAVESAVSDANSVPMSDDEKAQLQRDKTGYPDGEFNWYNPADWFREEKSGAEAFRRTERERSNPWGEVEAWGKADFKASAPDDVINYNLVDRLRPDWDVKKRETFKAAFRSAMNENLLEDRAGSARRGIIRKFITALREGAGANSVGAKAE